MTAEAFSVYVRDEAWLIRTVIGANWMGYRPSSIWEVGSTNGQEIVQVGWWRLDSPPNWAQRLNAPRSFGADPVPMLRPWPEGFATIWSNPAPPRYVAHGEPFSPHLWLMFASGCYLLLQTNQELIPVYDTRTSEPYFPYPPWAGGWGKGSTTTTAAAPRLYNPAYRTLRLEAHWQLGRQEPHLPVYVAYWNRRGFPRLDQQGNLTFVPFHPPFTAGCLEAFYGVTGTTNVDGLLLPTGFIFQRFELCTFRLSVQERLYVVVTNATARCSRASLLPPLPVVWITDHRLLEAEPALAKMEYPALHLRRWPTVAESKRAYLAWQRKKQWEVQRATPWQLAGFGLLVVAPVAWVWLHSRRPKPPH